MRTYYYVDLPTYSGVWEHIDDFDSKEEAIAFCKRKYGADDEGRISLISWTDEDEDDDDES